MKGATLALVSLLVLTATSLYAQFTYTVLDLGTLGGAASMGNAVNNNGQVAGTSYLSGDQMQSGFLSGPDGAQPLQNLGTLGGSQSFGQAITSGGQVAGVAQLTADDGPYHAFLSAPNGGTLGDLGTLGGTHSYGYGVNASGRVAGYSLVTGNVATHAFLSGANGGALLDLGTLPSGSNSFATAVNTNGQVAGYSDTASPSNHAFISDANGGSLRDLGTLGGRFSFGLAINDAGQVAGRSETSTIGQHAFVSDPNGGALHDLSTLGGTSSFGEGINADGSVTGYSFLSDNSTQHAFLYKPATGMLDLNNLLVLGTDWTLIDAKAINDSGQIAGYGTIGGEFHAFLLSPVLPEVRITSITKLANGHIFVQGLGAPSKNHTVQATANLTTQFGYAGTIIAASDGSIQFEDTSARDYTARFYRLVYP